MTKIALVTGANKGIGYEIARQLLERDVKVLLGARDEGRGKAASAELRTPFIQLDVTDAESIAAAAKRIGEDHGSLDILVNNAGVSGAFAPPSGTTVDDLRRVFDTNLFGVVAVTNAMLPLLRRSSSARVVNVSSEVGSLTMASDRHHRLWSLISGAYPASKAALNMLTLHYAKELDSASIKVNMVSPGYCATDFTRHQGFRTAAQGAAVAVEMATLPDDGPTGTFVDDGGAIAW